MKIILRHGLDWLLGFTFLFMLLLHSTVLAQGCETPVATATSVQGTVEAKLAGDQTWQAVQLNNRYCPGDTIRVQVDSRADLTLANRSVLRLNANSEMTLGAVEKKTYFVDEFAQWRSPFF